MQVQRHERLAPSISAWPVEKKNRRTREKIWRTCTVFPPLLRLHRQPLKSSIRVVVANSVLLYSLYRVATKKKKRREYIREKGSSRWRLHETFSFFSADSMGKRKWQYNNLEKKYRGNYRGEEVGDGWKIKEMKTRRCPTNVQITQREWLGRVRQEWL